MTDVRRKNEGKIKIVPLSGLRKRMRVARRGKLDALAPSAKAIARHVHPRRLRSIA